MTRTMYDSVNATAIPTAVSMVAGYLPPSRFAWSDADWARFPTAVKVRIAVRATTDDGVVLDVEQGDATPQQAPSWVLMRRAAGVDPTVYCSEAAWSAVRQAFAAANVAQPHYWVAAYPGAGPSIPAGAIAHQYADPPNSGGDWDLSVVADHWPGVDQEEPVTDLQNTDESYIDLTWDAQAVRSLSPTVGGTGSNAGDENKLATVLNGLVASVAVLTAKVDALQLGTALSGTANVTIQLAPVAEADTIQGE